MTPAENIAMGRHDYSGLSAAGSGVSVEQAILTMVIIALAGHIKDNCLKL